VDAQPPIAGYPQPGSSAATGDSAAADPHLAPDPYSAADPYAAPNPYAAPAPHPASAWGQPGAYPYPPPPYGQPPAYGPVPGYGGPDRPGTAVGAAVLAFVAAGLDLFGSLASLGLAVGDTVMDEDWRQQYLAAAALLSVIAGGLLIAGGVTMLKGRPGLLLAGGICTAAVAAFWIGSFGTDRLNLTGMVVTYGLVYLALAVVMVALAYSTSARKWCRIVASPR